ncbi:hypothetical protein Droror1_Dr00025236 [Drosera rotundifolia]
MPSQEVESQSVMKREDSGVLLKPKQDLVSKSDAQIVSEQTGNMAPVARIAIPEIKFNFVSIDNLGPYVNGRELVDVIGVVQNISSTVSIRRKGDNEVILKRDITIADESKKTVVVSLWNDLATTVGQELLDIADRSPVIAIKSLKVGDFSGVSLSTIGKSIVQIDPEIPESKKLRSWYNSEGKEVSMASVGADLSLSAASPGKTMYSDRVLAFQLVLDHEEVEVVAETNIVAEKPVNKIWSGAEAATIIQSAFRGYELRRCEPLKKLKQFAEVCQAIEDCKAAGIRVIAIIGDNKNTAEVEPRHLKQNGGLLFTGVEPKYKQEMGMNVVSKGVQNVLDFLMTDFPDMDVIGTSDNFCSDKKPAAVNWIEGCGKSVVF